MFVDSSIKEYLKKLSSEEPIPGGGGTSALVAALGIGLMLMVARISLKKQEGEKRENLLKVIETLDRMQQNASEIIDLDPKVYGEVMNSYLEAKKISDPELAQQKIETALKNSFRLQADLAMLIVMAKEFLSSINSCTKGSIRNDLLVASGLLDGAFYGALATANINVVYMKDAKERAHCEEAMAKLKERHSKAKFEIRW
ncbi:MAG: cyclodeaminase/cyclohydrolase family protein [Candidatus Omnitrophica bacterium]|nr:cyclodeaminase/cyclohydrolase family protein [Candidatus Omnitrophota bacterium]